MADGEQNDKKREEDQTEETPEAGLPSGSKTQPESRSDKRTVKQIIDEVLNFTVIKLPHQQQKEPEDNSNSPSKLITVKEILGELLEYNVCDKISTESSNSDLFDSQYYGEPSTSTAPTVQTQPQNLELPRDFHIYRGYDQYEPIICYCDDEHMLRRTDSVVPVTRILPSYSSVMRQGPQTHIKSGDSFIPKIPPPSYAEVEGIYDEMPSTGSSESVAFGPDPLYLICPICRIIVMTEIERERTTITHWIALLLCVFLCWPCCLLPYYMKSCSYTYHSCPNCGHYFGMFNPF